MAHSASVVIQNQCGLSEFKSSSGRFPLQPFLSMLQQPTDSCVLLQQWAVSPISEMFLKKLKKSGNRWHPHPHSFLDNVYHHLPAYKRKKKTDLTLFTLALYNFSSLQGYKQFSIPCSE